MTVPKKGLFWRCPLAEGGRCKRPGEPYLRSAALQCDFVATFLLPSGALSGAQECSGGGGPYGEGGRLLPAGDGGLRAPGQEMNVKPRYRAMEERSDPLSSNFQSHWEQRICIHSVLTKCSVILL